MSPERYRELAPLFAAALERPPEEREDFARELCAGNLSLVDDLLELIRHYQDSDPDPEPDFTRGRFEAGDVIAGRFQIVRFVAEGGMGEVYEARDAELGERVALKTIRPEIANLPRALARFKREIQLARRVTHPNVCRVHDLFTARTDDGLQTAFLSMEYLEGESLAERIRRDGPLPDAQAREIAFQLCDALDAAQRAGVVHRDFKSANVMLTDGGRRAVVTDFGLAREAEPSPTGEGITRTGAVVGTTTYMSPEQLEGAEVGSATDVYALGIVLFEMLAGHLPFRASTPGAAAVERAHSRPSVRKSAPAAAPVWERVVDRCLAYRIPDRPSVADVREMLATSRVPVVDRLRAVSRRRTMLWGGAAVAVALVAMVYSISLSLGYRKPPEEAQRWFDEGSAALREGTYLKAAKALERAVRIDAGFVLAHARLADAYAELDYVDKAKDELLRASSPQTLSGSPALDRQYVEAVRTTLTSDFKKAVEGYRHILDALPANQKAYGVVDLGRAQEKAGDIPAAVDSYARASREAPEYPASFIRLGVLYSRLKRNAEAGAAFARAEELYKAASNQEGLAELQYQRGLAASQGERLAEARSYADTALAAARTIESVPLEIRALLLSSGVDDLRGNSAEAERSAQRAIELARGNGINYWSGQGLILVGNSYLDKDPAKAGTYFEEARMAAQRSASPRLEAFAQLSLAGLRDKQGRPDEAIALAQPALEYYRERGFVRNWNLAIVILARARRNKGDLKGALEAFNKQLEIGRQSGDASIVAPAEESIGAVLHRLERYPEALAHYRAAADAYQERPPNVALEMMNQANALVDLGRYSEAEALLKRVGPALRQEPERASQMAVISMYALLGQGENKEALALGLKTPRFPSTMASLDLGICLARTRSGPAHEAVAYCSAALQRAAAVGPREAALAGLALGEALLNANDLAGARRHAETALEWLRSAGMLDSSWRALHIVSLIEAKSRNLYGARQKASEAVSILESLTHDWDADNSASFGRRADVRAARRDLTRLAGKS